MVPLGYHCFYVDSNRRPNCQYTYLKRNLFRNTLVRLYVYDSYLIAPTGPPTTLSVDLTTSTTIEISFFQPAGILQNGPILSYDVFYKGLTFNTSESTENFPVLVEMDPMVATFIFHLTLTGLQEYNTYEIRVRAVNAVGPGPINNPTDETTAQSGKF